MVDSHLFCDNSDNDTLIMTFASFELNVAGIPRYEFFNFLNKNYSQYDHSFFIDKKYCWYNKGLEGISETVEETVSYIEEHTKDYNKVVYLGISAGAYAAILYGSLCSGNNSVVAITPQTDLAEIERRKKDMPPFVVTNWDDLDPNYMDLKPLMRDDNHYIIVSQPRYDVLHHHYHIERVIDLPFVTYHQPPDLDMRVMRDSGHLGKLIDMAL